MGYNFDTTRFRDADGEGWVFAVVPYSYDGIDIGIDRPGRMDFAKLSHEDAPQFLAELAEMFEYGKVDVVRSLAGAIRGVARLRTQHGASTYTPDPDLIGEIEKLIEAIRAQLTETK